MKLTHVLIVGSTHTPSYTIGIKQPFDFLQEQGECSYEAKSEDEVSKRNMANADVIIFLRTIRSETYDLMEWARKLGIKTVYAIDDQFLAMSATTELGKHYASPSIRATFTQFLRNTQIVKVDSSYFAWHIRTHFDPAHVVYFPASVDFSFIDSLNLRHNAATDNRGDQPVVIGYMGGEKEAAFAPLIPALEQILAEYKGKVRLEFMGYIPSELRHHHAVSYINEVSDYKQFVKQFSSCGWDIGLAPLEDTLFHRCKTNNKFREYATFRIPGIYSVSPVYMDWVAHEETGLFVPQTQTGWYLGLKKMIENPSLRQNIRVKAETLVRKKFTIEACADHWLKDIVHA